MKKPLLLVLLLLSMIPVAVAQSASLDTPLSDDDKAKFDKILEPIMKIELNRNFRTFVSF